MKPHQLDGHQRKILVECFNKNAPHSEHIQFYVKAWWDYDLRREVDKKLKTTFNWFVERTGGDFETQYKMVL